MARPSVMVVARSFGLCNALTFCFAHVGDVDARSPSSALDALRRRSRFDALVYLVDVDELDAVCMETSDLYRLLRAVRDEDAPRVILVAPLLREREQTLLSALAKTFLGRTFLVTDLEHLHASVERVLSHTAAWIN